MRPQERDPGKIPNYDLLRFVRSGGFGDVWLARERVTGVLRAVKTVYKAEPERAARDIAGVQRYQRCAHNHPHLLQILTVGENAQCFYYVTEMADNGAVGAAGASVGHVAAPSADAATPASYEPLTLRALVRARRRFDAESALRVVQKLASGVARLHEQGLAHYDLKPENILLIEGEPRIADVGLVAPVNEPPPRSGTPLYMTPQGRPDDLYALGLVLYELVTGRPATDFPRLPPELLREARPELTTALQIVNRACHTDPPQRFASAGALLAVLSQAVRRETGVTARWRRLSWPGRAAVLLVVVLIVCVAAQLVRMAFWPHAAPTPAARVVRAYDVPLDSQPLTLVRASERRAGEPAAYPYVRVAGRPLAQAGAYALRLERGVENFVVDWHVSCARPWGGCALGVAAEPAGQRGATVALKGQPEGLGLRCLFWTVNDADWRADPPEKILGHPQPGLQYILRLARCKDEVVAAMWPLASANEEPYVLRMPLPRGGIEARYLTLEAQAASALDRVDVLGVHVVEYSGPLQRGDEDPPRAVAENAAARRVTPALVPAVPAGAGALEGNLLAGRWHPFDSGLWTPLGSWAWWPGASPEAREKPIRCTPFSADERRGHGEDRYYEGFQLLRFDGAELGDCDVSVRLRLGYRDGNGEHRPFTCESHEGFVGLAVRMQAAAAPGAAYGGGYLVGVHLAAAGGPVRATVLRCAGFALRRQLATMEGSVPLQVAPEVGQVADFLPPEELTLRVRAVGPRIRAYLNEREVLDATDTAADYYAVGRVALVSARLMATFETLTITAAPPADSE